MDFHETWIEDESQPRIEPFKFVLFNFIQFLKEWFMDLDDKKKQTFG